IAGKEIGIGDNDVVSSDTKTGAVGALDVVVVTVVVARQKQCCALALGTMRSLQAAAQSSFLSTMHRRIGEVTDVLDNGAMQFSRIVLLGFGAEVAKMVLGVIDAADEGYLLVHHRYLAMHAAQRVDTKAEHSGARIENMETHPG